MRCLNDIEVQAIVDGEELEENVARTAHVSTCGRCRTRVDERRREMALVTSLLSGDAETSADDLEALGARLQRATVDGRLVRGATALRSSTPRFWRRPGWVSALATAAVIAVVVFLILPKLGAPTTLSASEVLGRSLKTLSDTSGVERLEYEFFVAGDMPGPMRIVHVIDHDRPGRFRIATYGADGLVDSVIAQDPATSRRTHLFRVDGRNYIITLASSGDRRLSLPEMGQAMVETAISMMQATSDQHLSTVDTPAGRQYVIEMPAVTPSSSAAVFDLYHARAVIDENDFRIHEFEAAGAVLKQPYSMTFRLISRTVRPSADVPAEEFTIAAGQNDMMLTGVVDRDPLTDVLTTVLRELGRVKSH